MKNIKDYECEVRGNIEQQIQDVIDKVRILTYAKYELPVVHDIDKHLEYWVGF